MLMLVAAEGASAAESVRQEGPLAVAEVLAGDLLRLADGRAVRLAGIRVPAGAAAEPSAARFAEKARAALRRLLEGQAITLGLAEAPYDRYGRLVAQIERGDGLWLQGALLERGLAQVHAAGRGGASRGDAGARAQRARSGPRAGGRAGLHAAGCKRRERRSGPFLIVRGTVVRVAPTERYLYLNFGADWRRDFTVRGGAPSSKALLPAWAWRASPGGASRYAASCSRPTAR
jgi:micrococcal nuclease